MEHNPTARRNWVYHVPLYFFSGLAITTCLVLAYIFGTAYLQRKNTEKLFALITARGLVAAAELEERWDRVCIATAYCGGTGDLDWDVCSSFQEDGAWGMVFFEKEKIVSLKKFSAHVRFKEAQLCYSRSEDPVLVQAGNKMITIRKRQN